jgi:hypothetical protein
VEKMPLKVGVCSDLDLEYHFKHMTSKKQRDYENKQLVHFDKFIEVCLEKKIEVLIIAGNLFGTPKPKNYILEKVVKGFHKLTTNGIYIFILPGSHDTPLTYTMDRPIHHIFEEDERIKILHESVNEERFESKISNPVFEGNEGNEGDEGDEGDEGELKGMPTNIFTVSSPRYFNRIQDLEFDLKVGGDGDNLNWFIISDFMAYKDKAGEVASNFFNKLDDTDIELLLVGGIIPESIDINEYGFKTINCPQIHKNNFDYSNNPSGLRIFNLNESKRIEDSGEIIEISSLNLKQEILDINQIPVDKINDAIKNLINNSSNINTLLQIKLYGNLDRENYHKIKIFHYLKKGKRMNFYFDLADLIQFEDTAPAIEGLSIIQELDNLVDLKIEKIESEFQGSEMELKQKISNYNESLNLIKDRWGIRE